MAKSSVIFQLIKQTSIIGIDLLFYVVKIILICAHSYCLKTKCQRLDFQQENRSYHFYTNHPGGDLVHKHQTIKFDVAGERSATNKINGTDKKSRIIASPQITTQEKKNKNLRKFSNTCEYPLGTYRSFVTRSKNHDGHF